MIVRRIILNPSEPCIAWLEKAVYDRCWKNTQFPELYFDPYESVVFEVVGGKISVRIVVCVSNYFCPPDLCKGKGGMFV